MRSDFYFESSGAGQIHAAKWLPGGEIKAVVQIIHGIAEHVERYDDFARYLTAQGYAVVAEDHMGHGKSVGGIRGYFHGGWFAAVEDSVRLMKTAMAEHPGVPYVLLGHSMGSFMARTILAKYPDSGIHACILSGTAWQSGALIKAGLPVIKLLCKALDETKPSTALHGAIFGGYNKRIEHPKTSNDWLSRDREIVRAYNEDPLCGFVASAGLLRDMMTGIGYIQTEPALQAMNKQLPVLVTSGTDDPVGSYGKGIDQLVEAFQKAGMERVTKKLYPLCRHEILNEINRQEVYRDLENWIRSTIG